jgi:nucleotide-binding universal stress UspA family protein
MDRFQHMLVGLTRSATDAGLAQYAAQVARLGTAREVRFLHVLPNDSAAGGVATTNEQAVRDLQASVQPHFEGISAHVQLAFDVLQGPLVDRFLTYAAEHGTDLMLVGHQLAHANRRSLARRLAMKAPCSIWMVPENTPAAIRKILVPIDFSQHSADSMRVATSLARLIGRADVIALHVYFNTAVVTYEEYDQVLRGEEEQLYRAFMSGINCADVRVTPLFRESANVAHAINRVADEMAADLIVMPTRGRSRAAAVLLGSVTEDTIIETHKPLLVVKHFGAQLGLLQALFDRKFRAKPDLHT